MSHELGGGFEFKFLERVKQRNLFRVTAAYLGLAWFVIHVATVIGESFPRVHHFVPWLIYGLGVGLPIVLITSWLSKRTPRRAARSVRLDVILMGVMVLAVLALLADRWVLHRPTDETMLALLAVMVVVLLIDRLIGLRSPAAAASSATHTKGMPRVAILPFADMSPEKNQDYFCEGTAEEIIDALCAVTGLHVASRSASFQLKNRAVDAREVGRLLNVHAFLEGSVRKSDDRLRITAQLIDVGHGGHLWSQSFDRKVEDIFSVQEDIARHVVAAMRVNLLDADSSRLKRRGTRNAAAYELYLRGRQLLNKEKEAENRAAVEVFREAIRLDPNFADAHAGLADVLTQLLRQRVIPSELSADALAASQRAVELAPDLADAYVARGNALLMHGEADEAQRAFERATALDPRNFYAHYWFAKFWVARAQHALAVKHYELAFEIQPDDYRPIVLSIQEYQAINDKAGEQNALRRAWPVLERRLALDPHDSYASDHGAGVLMLLGRRDEANRLLDRAIALRPDDYRTLYTAACTAALGGEYDRALDFLDRAVGTGRGDRIWLLNDNDLAPLREHPRFKQIVDRLK
ncbi:MAG TPA: tetratricopeptide repeat protein [Steroidobacteraceae bacterium]|nr:tetratricopeptide repeat protein [Steroidobacteraceae bacterium]